MATPTLIGMPEPPSNPDTPTEMPGTPNSTTTSLSCLSTTAIKDGHRGHAFPHTGLGHHHTPSSNTLEAERADRISRLAGLERVSTARANAPPGQQGVAGIGTAAGGPVAGGQLPGYFDQNGNPVYTTKMSTVGSASATGSVSGGGNTNTWASGSTKGADDDEMSMDTNLRDYDDRDRFSASGIVDEDDGMSDDTSLVGFGEGAGSTVSGPIYSRREAGRSGLAGQLQRDESFGSAPVSERTTATADQQRKDARMIDGLAADDLNSGYVDTAARGGQGARVSGGGGGVETAERILRERIDDESDGRRPLGTPDEAGLGKFYFEEKK